MTENKKSSKRKEKRMHNLAERMKLYEAVPANKLMRRTPVIIRIDGCHFKSFTEKFMKPFDTTIKEAMLKTTKYLCENIPGCVLGYTQSDEITLVLVDYKTLESAAWYDYKVEKLCSVSASYATFAFNKYFLNSVHTLVQNYLRNRTTEDMTEKRFSEFSDYTQAYADAIEKGATFDARCFNLPLDEVTNNIFWRQSDASRNSIQMFGHTYFGKRINGLSNSEVQELLFSEAGINWINCSVYEKRGACVLRTPQLLGEISNDNTSTNDLKAETTRPHWVIDENIPIFKGDDRDYIEKLIRF